MSSTRQLFLQHVAQTSDFPIALEIERAQGNYLFDANGKQYLDLISGISVASLGHSHPHIVEAIQKQAATNLHLMVYGEYVIGPQVKLATALSKHLPGHLSSVYFVNSGSEAIEGAMKLAKRYTGRTKIVSFKNSYHGSSQGALSLGGDENMRNAFRPLLPGMVRLDYNRVDQLHEIDTETAAVIIEPVQAEAGVMIPDKNYLQQVKQACEKAGALLIFDEIQTGYGRLGKLFALEYFDVSPDVLVLGKAFGGGMPLGAFVSSASIMQCLRNDPVLGHITTFGGHPVCCAASLAALEIITSSGLMQEVEKKSELFKSLLPAGGKIKAVRGAGLMLAVQLESFEAVQEVMRYCLEHGVIVDWFLYNSSAIRISAPLTITEEEIRRACEVLSKGIERLSV
jgi:acetylornithine/succinyldiaminopimelate/putrescine aminotransferase